MVKTHNAPPLVPEHPPGVRRLVPVKEACRYGRFGKSKAFHLIANEKIKAYREGGRTLIDLNSIDEYYATLDQVMLQPGRRY